MKITQVEEIGLNMLHLIQQNNLTPERQKISLDQFNLLSVIGKGAMGKVVLVRKKDNKKIYALKVIKRSKLIENRFVSQIYAERNILINCHHPFIVKLEYAFQTIQKLYFCLHYCPGGELYNLLVQKHKLTEEQAKFYSAQILLALQYLHEQNIIYRDLKPENVLIDFDGYIKLTDFGYSKTGITGNIGAHSKCGTAEYLAPELLAGNYGKAADWWAFGNLLFEMATGEPAFYAESKEQLFDLILHKEINFQKIGVSPHLKDLLSKLLQKDPVIRLCKAEEIQKHPWFKHMEWDLLIQKQIPAFFIPKLNNDEDLSHFDELILKEPIYSYSNSQTFEEKQISPLKEFSYQASPEKQQWEF